MNVTEWSRERLQFYFFSNLDVEAVKCVTDAADNPQLGVGQGAIEIKEQVHVLRSYQIGG